MGDRMACDGGSGGGSLTDRREYLKLLVGASGALAGCYLPGNSTDWTRPRRSMVRSAVFGPSVAIDGETALVGATWNREGDEPDVDTEIAFVFSRESGEWTPEAMLRPDSPADGFGDSVALAGDVALVGARLDNRPPPDSTETDTKPSDDTIKRRGSVSVFARTSGEWSREAILTPNDAESWDRFGSSVAMDTDTAVVGANGYSRHPDGTESAYIFERTEE